MQDLCCVLLVSKNVMHKGLSSREKPGKEIADEKELFVTAARAEIEPITSLKKRRKR